MLKYRAQSIEREYKVTPCIYYLPFLNQDIRVYVTSYNSDKTH